MAKPDYGAGALRALISAKRATVEATFILRHPSATQVKTKRIAAGFTQAAAAKLVHVSLRTWQDWESKSTKAKRRMPLAAWELFNLLCDFEAVRRARRQWYEQLAALCA